MEHTKTPWEISHHVKLPNCHTPSTWQIVKHDFPDYPYEGELEEEWGMYPPLGEAGPIALIAGGANAAFIVKACNLHDELVEALKDTCNLLDIFFENPQFTVDELIDMSRRLRKAHAVLAKVEEK